ncbi:adenylate/guanylate cyclase domain-containing protein [Paenimyroides baculatum]|uniref:Adenylate cyclase n=1 Tax=Paenimyroides baculatum TaxID=2608000 RepID=A0A5M6CQR4_9FLAO|nr:adenylate/guanylate cyclase domain-containing protein [Paenimyroides baculatum]KAA5535485.1 tetratricopeptide repeat protein [Paenimyroides baculatum]
MKKIIVLFVFLISTFGFSQDKYIQIKLDSLEVKLHKAKNDSEKLNISLGLGKDYAVYSNKKNFEFNEDAIKLAEKLNKPIAIAEAYANISTFHEGKNDTLQQLDFINKILELGNKKNDNTVLGKGYYEKAFYYWTRNDNKKIIQNFLKAEYFFRKSNNKKYLSDLYLQFGFFYQSETKDYNQALEYYKKFTHLFNENSFELVNTYNLMANLYAKQNKFKKALEHYQKSAKLHKQYNDTKSHHYGYLLSNIANIYSELNEYDKSFTYHNLALDFFLKLKDHNNISLIYISKSTVYQKLNQPEKISQNINLAIENTKNIKECLVKEAVYSRIGNIYYDLENYQKALEFHLKAYHECPLNKPYKLIDDQEYCIGTTYLKLAQNINKTTNEGAYKDKYQLLELSKQYLNKVINKAIKKDDILMLNNTYLNLSEISDLQADKSKALEYYKQHIIYKDSLEVIENRELLVQNQMQFEFDQQEKIRNAEQKTKDALAREELTKEKNKRNLALIGFGVFVILASFAAFAYSQKKKDHKIISEEKQKSDNLLLNILPEEVAKELKEKGTSEARHFESVSIMFTDFKDFTKLSEKIPSKELIEELNYCFKAFDEIVAKHGVEKIKTIGDSYMAVCGLPAKYGNHAQKMVQAAIEIRDFIEDYKLKRQSESKSFFEMRIGINSGEVVAGIVGIKKFAYDIWGDAVNTASRMESNGEIGKVNISESTYNLVKDDFYFEFRGELEAKGKGKIKMYFVDNKKT